MCSSGKGGYTGTEDLIGNTLEESAYHESGHAVLVAAIGLDLRPSGILILSTDPDDITDGLTCYWKETPDAETAKKVLVITRAGQLAQLKQFPSSDTAIGSTPDRNEFFSIVGTHFGKNLSGDMWQNAGSQALHLLELHWNAVTAVARALIVSPWLPVEPNEHHPRLTRKKHLDGATLVKILEDCGISARVRA